MRRHINTALAAYAKPKNPWASFLSRWMLFCYTLETSISSPLRTPTVSYSIIQ